MTLLADAHGALSAIVAGLKRPEYLGDATKKRLLLHANTVRRGLEVAERPSSLPDGWRVKGLIVVCSVCVQNGEVPAPPAELRSDTYCDRHFDHVRAQVAARRAR
jgi:hypothetical protein